MSTPLVQYHGRPFERVWPREDHHRGVRGGALLADYGRHPDPVSGAAGDLDGLWDVLKRLQGGRRRRKPGEAGA